MLKFLIFLVFLVSSSIFVTQAFSLEVELQKESDRIIESMGWLTPEIHSFQEQFQIIIDETNQRNRISIGLLSTNPNDIIFPDNIEAVSSDPRIFSYTLTNQFGCAPNAIESACIIVAVNREGLGNSLEEIKVNAREITDKIAYSTALSTPEFDSIILQSKTSYSGDEEVIIAQSIYKINKQPTNKLFTALSTMLINSEIRTAGGFYENAEKLSENYFSEFTATLVPLNTLPDKSILRSLHISLTCSNHAPELPRCDNDDSIGEQIRLGNISPLDFIQAENISKSKIFEDQFTPLNSIVQVMIFSEQDLQVKSVSSNIIKKFSGLGDIQESGWFFVSTSGNKIDGRYIFGSELSANKNDLVFTIGPNSGEDIKIKPIKEVKDGGGCLIATATFGSEMAPQIQFLREIRDNIVLQTESGTNFMTAFNQFYYSFSPAVADYERENPAFKEAVKITLTPLLTSLTLLQYADIDSESEMLGYGIGVILLNIAMYFVAPVVLIMTVKKRI